MITAEQTLKCIMRKVACLPHERRALGSSLGFVLSRDIRTSLDFPPFDRSAMDGYAIAGGREGSVLAVRGEVCAGQRPRTRVRAGEAVKIMTGAMLPKGAVRVIMKEHVDVLEGGKIRIRVAEEKGHVLRKGLDLRKGSRLCGAGQIVTPIVLANIAAAGVGAVSVYRKPRIAILVTGSELLKPGVKYQTGKIYNSNGPLLQALLAVHGFSDVTQMAVPDSLPPLVSALRKALATSEVVIISGGISVGDYDFVGQALDAIDCKVHVSKVAIQPGKPFTFATRGPKPVFALPGNPVSVFVTYYLFALPAILKMRGIGMRHVAQRRTFRGAFERRRAERELYLPVAFVGDDAVEAIPFHGSGDLHALGKADGLMIVPVGKTGVANAEDVDVLSLMDINSLHHGMGMD